jgi:hypothetical protein
MSLRMNQQILCYLTEDANSALKELCSLGMDEDLALAFLEQVWPEHAIYDIPSEPLEWTS